MRLLLLGGPRFLGRALLAEALRREHEVTTFNRTGTDPEVWPRVESLRGDRDGDLVALEGGSWDAVLDTSGYLPRVVGAGARLLAEAAERYAFVSSISVYASFAERVDEESAVAVLDDPSSEDVQAGYGALKALCEREVESSFPGRALHVRAGLIVGPSDPTGRFTYWPHRVARGGELLVPAPLDRPVQLVDVRDLAAWIVTSVEGGLAGTFNATCDTTLGRIVETSALATAAEPDVVEVDPAFLREHEVGEWMELPLWIDDAEPDHRHFMDVRTERVQAAGLRARPLDETIAATLAEAEPVEGVGLTPEREAALIAAWRAS